MPPLASPQAMSTMPASVTSSVRGNGAQMGGGRSSAETRPGRALAAGVRSPRFSAWARWRRAASRSARVVPDDEAEPSGWPLRLRLRFPTVVEAGYGVRRRSPGLMDNRWRS